MMPLRLFSKNLVKAGLNSLIIAFLILGCSPSTIPSYTTEQVAPTIEDIAKAEYDIHIKADLIGKTLWVYLPVVDLLVKPEKPKKYTEEFIIEGNSGSLEDESLKLNYIIKPTGKVEKLQEYVYDKKTLNNMNKVWGIIRRVLFSSEFEPRFIYFAVSDIKNGFETKEITYYNDFKKVSYNYISWTEYQHRASGAIGVSPLILDDKEGLHLDYRDITMQEFIIYQIQHRINLKFQKPEVTQDTDIEKEVLKTAIDTIKLYNFRDFLELEINNPLTNRKITLNQRAIWGDTTKQ